MYTDLIGRSVSQYVDRGTCRLALPLRAARDQTHARCIPKQTPPPSAIDVRVDRKTTNEPLLDGERDVSRRVDWGSAMTATVRV